MNKKSESSNHRILVVDDNPSIHEDFRKILSPSRNGVGASLASMAAELFEEIPATTTILAEFQMDSAFQGQEALAKIQAAEEAETPYSLAFMDVRMPPGWDGVETISKIWKQYPHIQVVICTAYSDYSWAQILEQLGETDNLVILKKPFDNVEVLQLAHTLTKKWTLNRQASARMADLDEMVRSRTQELTEANQHLRCEVQRRSLMETALRESEERFHKAFETVPVACAIRPLDSGRYLDVNECFSRICGYTKEEILGKTPQELNLFVAPEKYEELVQSLRAGQRIRDAEVEFRRKNGEHRHALESIELLKLGDQSCLLTVIQDVTEQRKIEGQLRQAQKMEAVGQFAAGVAHDFNNLLTVIQGYASLQLAKTALDADVAKAFSHVKLASERASALTRQLLAFSRPQIVQLKRIELSATILKMKPMLSRILGQTISAEYRCDSIQSWVDADEANVEQVVMNLVLNARDAMPKGGKLSFGITRQTVSAGLAARDLDKHAGEFVVLNVTDTGCGMDPQTISRIFEPFFTTKPIGRGTGLGLSTVYTIVKQHGGWLEVDSHVGSGTTLRVFLPAIEPPIASDPPPSDSTPTKTQLCQEDVILVIENDGEVREFIVSVLTSQGYKVIHSNSGAEALRNWPKQDCHVRLLITDMVMSGIGTGSVFARRLMRSAPDLRVISTSSCGFEPGSGGNPPLAHLQSLSKPFTQERLLQIVHAALGAGKTSSPAPTVPIVC